jgi:hypothetical protein
LVLPFDRGAFPNYALLREDKTGAAAGKAASDTARDEQAAHSPCRIELNLVLQRHIAGCWVQEHKAFMKIASVCVPGSITPGVKPRSPGNGPRYSQEQAHPSNAKLQFAFPPISII